MAVLADAAAAGVVAVATAAVAAGLCDALLCTLFDVSTRDATDTGDFLVKLLSPTFFVPLYESRNEICQQHTFLLCTNNLVQLSHNKHM